MPEQKSLELVEAHRDEVQNRSECRCGLWRWRTRCTRRSQKWLLCSTQPKSRLKEVKISYSKMDGQPQAPREISVFIPEEKGIQGAETTQQSQESISNDHQIIVPPIEISQPEDMELLEFIKEQGSKRSGANQTDSVQRTKICRVPDVLRENFKEHYNPRAIAIGPINHPNFEEKPLMKEFKGELAARYFEDSKQEGDWLLSVIKANIRELKESFDEEVIKGCDDDKLARILFLDGCAMLQFIYSYANNKLNEFKINRGQAELVQQDLFLLENQIPFRVLILLLRWSKDKEKKKEFILSIIKFIGMNTMAPPTGDFRYPHLEISPLFEDKDQQSGQSKTPSPVHLLDLLRSTLLLDDDCFQESRLIDRILSAAISALVRLIDRIISATMVAILFCYFMVAGALETCFRNRCTSCILFSGVRFMELYFSYLVYRTSNPMYGPSFRNVQELKATGIKLKPSHSTGMKAISFNTQFFGMTGMLKLPPLTVDMSTILKLWNLVAYEMCPHNYKNDRGITSYISFLDSLIDIEQDVKDLRSVQILWNRLSSDVEVARLFNMIGSHLVPDDKAYSELKSEIQKHYQRRYASWIAQVIRDHFSSPWTILALSAAVTALLFTGIQTWYAVYPKNGAN